jgi:hypothetical protein
MLEAFSTPLLLRKLFKGIDRLAAAQEESNRLAALALKLELIRADLPLAALQAAEESPAGGPAVETLSQTDSDFALRERMEKLMAEFFHGHAKEVPEGIDPIEWGKKEGYIDRSADEVDEEAPAIRVFNRAGH